MRVPGEEAGLLVSPWLSAFTMAFIQVNERLTSLVTQVGEQVLIEVIKQNKTKKREQLSRVTGRITEVPLGRRMQGMGSRSKRLQGGDLRTVRRPDWRPQVAREQEALGGCPVVSTNGDQETQGPRTSGPLLLPLW